MKKSLLRKMLPNTKSRGKQRLLATANRTSIVKESNRQGVKRGSDLLFLLQHE